MEKGMRCQGIGAIGCVTVGWLAGCAGPHGGWSEARLQTWAERNFALGTPRPVVTADLDRRKLKWANQDPGFTRGRDEVWIHLETPFYSQPLFGLALVGRFAGIILYFDDRDELNEIKAWVSAVGP